MFAINILFMNIQKFSKNNGDVMIVAMEITCIFLNELRNIFIPSAALSLQWNGS